MDDIEIPHHFICPISLQIMKDPVTVATGITYERDSIQRWQSHGQNKTCPVTNQPLPIDDDFTPNHNLRRLIQSWRASDQVTPSKQSCFQMKVIAINLIKNLKVLDLKFESLKSLESLASESENNRVCLKEVGVVRAMFSIVVSCYQNCIIVGLKEALNVLYLVRLTQDETHSIVAKNDRIISSLTWVLDLDACDEIYTTMKFHAMVLLKDIMQHAKSHVLERLNREFFKTIVLILHHQRNNNNNNNNNLEYGMIKEVLHVMLSTCTWPRNCAMMIDSGAVFELVELELRSPEKALTEVIMAILFHLCSSADGRAQLLGHAAGIAMITKRIGTVSQKAGERALMIISLISKFSGTDGVLQEMVRVGTVEKLCTVLQVYDGNSYTRDTAKDILKRHLNVWSGSPCLDATILTVCLR
ncbi:putative U box domain, armadillo-like helical, Zinc finger, RING/FYVE/PHD-type [Helianthus annuus]|nr:putative U box domain, armadillo-like helical, Zinc finger, RING/FYVE/PHD-type [Helianthus annuus]